MIVIVGLGSIGVRHAKNLLDLGHTYLIGVDTRCYECVFDVPFPVYDSVESIDIERVTRAIICTPPDLHHQHAKQFVGRGIPTFIEKPMTTYAADASALCATAHMNKSVLAVGYMERAHPTVQEAKEFIQKYGCQRASIGCYWLATDKTYAINEAEESSHALDLALYLFGESEVVEWEKHFLGDFRVETQHQSGTRCTIRMNMNEWWARRSIHLVSSDGQRKFSALYGENKAEWDECYRAELRAFLNGKPLCTGEDGLRVVKILEELR